MQSVLDEHLRAPVQTSATSSLMQAANTLPGIAGNSFLGGYNAAIILGTALGLTLGVGSGEEFEPERTKTLSGIALLANFAMFEGVFQTRTVWDETSYSWAKSNS